MATNGATPCHVIAGPLGVGKTTAILQFLQRHAGLERVGVLVNDIGPLGLDASTLDSGATGSRIVNVPGGCVCCTMLHDLERNLASLLKTGDLTRLLIEPSGIATPATVVDLLRDMAARLRIEVRPVIGMLSAAAFDAETFRRMPLYRNVYESADVLVFNRADAARAGQCDQALAWARDLDPAKLRVLATSFGEIPDSVFDLRCPAAPAFTFAPAGQVTAGVCVPTRPHVHEHDPNLHPGGFVHPPETVFDAEAVLVNMMRVCHVGIGGVRVIRFKGVFHTNDGWLTLHIANREVTSRPALHRLDSRAEWISEGGAIAPEAMSQALLASPLA